MRREPTPIPSANLLGLPVHAMTQRECIEVILARQRSGLGGWVVTPNLDILRRCVRDDGFRRMIAQADLVLADGMPLVWASRLRRTPLPERVAGSTLFPQLCAAAAEEGRSVFLLGGSPGAADRAADVLRERHRHIEIAGTHCPPIFDPDHESDVLSEIEAVLMRTSPDIIFVGLGSPKQEKLILRVRSRLPSAWWLGIGVSFSFLSGQIRRAPVWMQRTGLEWAHRLAQEPSRLARRYIIDGIPFAAQLLARSAWEGMVGQKARG